MKTINIKVGKLETLIAGLNKIVEMDIKPNTSLIIARILKKLMEEYEIYDKERKKLCEKHAKKNEDGSAVIIMNEDNTNGAYDFENPDKFRDEFNELLVQEIEFSFKPIDENGLPEVPPYKLVPIEELFVD
jgi:hypothetical protein